MRRWFSIATISIALLGVSLPSLASDLKSIVEDMRASGVLQHEAIESFKDAALLRAVFGVDPLAVEQLLQTGVDPNEAVEGARPLCEVFIDREGRGEPFGADRLDIVRLLVSAGATGDQTCLNGWTPFSLAFYRSAYGAIDLMIDAGLRIGRKDASTVYTHALHDAVKRDSIEELRRLFAAGVHPDHNDAQPMLLAISRLRPHMVAEFLAAGASVAPPEYLTSAVNPRAEDASIVELLLGAGADPNAVDQYDRKPLHLALTYNLTPVVNLLLQSGANPNTHHEDGQPLLGWIQRWEPARNAQIEALVSAHADPHLAPMAPDTSLLTPFARAIARNDVDLVRRLVVAGADVNRQTKSKKYVDCMAKRAQPKPSGPLQIRRSPAPMYRDGCESPVLHPLVQAIDGGMVDMFDALVAHGADTDLRIADRITLLEYAVRHYRGEPFVDRLLRAGASPNQTTDSVWPVVDVNRTLDRPAIWVPPTSENPRLPLLTAAALGGNLKLVERLLQAGADVNATTLDGSTALHCLAGAKPGFVKYEQAAELILRAGADISLHDSKGYTPTTLALQERRGRIYQMLLAQEVDVNQLDGGGRSILSLAIEFTRDKWLVTALIERGAIVRASDVAVAKTVNHPSLLAIVEEAAGTSS